MSKRLIRGLTSRKKLSWKTGETLFVKDVLIIVLEISSSKETFEGPPRLLVLLWGSIHRALLSVDDQLKWYELGGRGN
jgi:hypothetical protein